MIPKNLEECLKHLEVTNKNNKELSEWLRLPDKTATGVIHFSTGLWM
jgi:hypothetical protein